MLKKGVAKFIVQNAISLSPKKKKNGTPIRTLAIPRTFSFSYLQSSLIRALLLEPFMQKHKSVGKFITPYIIKAQNIKVSGKLNIVRIL